MNYIFNAGRATVLQTSKGSKLKWSLYMYDVLCFESWEFISIKPPSVGSVFVNQLGKEDLDVELVKPINFVT